MASSDRFGYEWNEYDNLEPKYEEQFRNWVYPLTEKDFRDKKILDVGCGMGRNSYWSLAWGASHVTAFDFDERTVNSARKTLSKYNGKHSVLFKDAYAMDWHEQFDIVFSIGVIHHLEEPEKVLINMVNATKSGGNLLVWVYSLEGNEWIVKFVDLFRKRITSRLPLPAVHILSYICSIPLWLFVKIFKGPSDYLRQLSTYGLKHIHLIVFDQLIPRVANYWSKKDVEALFSGLALKSYTIYRPPNKMGWTIIGKK